MGKSRSRKRRRDEVTTRRVPTFYDQTYKMPSTDLSSFLDDFRDVRSVVDLVDPQRARPTSVGPRFVTEYQNKNLERQSSPYDPFVARKMRPARVEKSLCESRRERKEVIFATGNSGRKGQRPPIWTRLSRVRCK